MIELGRASEAVDVLERAVAIELPDHVPAHDATGPVFALARALWQSGGDRRRAIELAKRAQTALKEADSTNEAEIVARWLADHRL